MQLNNLETIRTLVKVERIWVNCLAVTSDIQCALSVAEKNKEAKICEVLRIS